MVDEKIKMRMLLQLQSAGKLENELPLAKNINGNTHSALNNVLGSRLQELLNKQLQDQSNYGTLAMNNVKDLETTLVSKQTTPANRPKRKICAKSGCETSARGATLFCIAHGGGKRCVEPGCKSGAQNGRFCTAHGGRTNFRKRASEVALDRLSKQKKIFENNVQTMTDPSNVYPMLVSLPPQLQSLGTTSLLPVPATPRMMQNQQVFPSSAIPIMPWSPSNNTNLSTFGLPLSNTLLTTQHLIQQQPVTDTILTSPLLTNSQRQLLLEQYLKRETEKQLMFSLLG